jgi:hypothetical protein
MAMVEVDGSSEWNGPTSTSSQSELTSDKADSSLGSGRMLFCSNLDP